ncbi:MAG: DUF5063 domain-containing protein [Gammaproteobacteria bacterium SHHR-1]|uniref:DUF5063 domain-containing protein n=1 Tax=Magnetovirga frankeli TaxID=947516 RepID=UPI001292E264|nr:DUF5063 domain-containing protein [gamma proteobacterium SS-5]
MSPELRNLLAIARNYCHLIEHSDTEQWLDDIAELLPQMHAAIARLGLRPRSEDALPGEEPVDLDQRFDLYVQLKSLLGDNDPYWMEYDGQDAQQMSGSLADDLTDIYCELKRGLEALGRTEEEAALPVLNGWRQGYQLHWGQHLLDAERHLYLLYQEGRL